MSALRTTTHPAARRVPGWALVALAVVSSALVAGHLATPGSGIGEATYLGSLGLATVVAWTALTRCPASARRAWSMVAVGLTLSALADLTFYVIYWTSGIEPDISVADAFWIGSYAALALGLLRLTPGRGRRRDLDVDAIIDSLVPAVLSLLVLWELVLDDMVTDSSTDALSRAVWTAYPVLDVVLLALVVRLAIHHHRSRSSALWLLGLGIVCWLAADVGYLFEVSDAAMAWLDVGWMAASLLLAAAVVVRTRVGAPDTGGVDVVHRGRMWLVMVPLLVPALLEVRGFVQDADPNPFVLGAAIVALVALASVRGHRLLRAAERARVAVLASEAHYRALASHSADGVVVASPDGTVVEVSGGLDDLIGRPAEALLGEDVAQALGCVDCRALETYVDTVRRSPGTVSEHEVEVRRADGEGRWLSLRMVNLIDDPAVRGVVVNLQDVTERRLAQDALAHQAFHDGLTGLANHALFTDRIEQALRRTARTGAEVALLYLDVDGFKSVNDRLGHAAGNQVLLEVATRLRGTVRGADTVARLGGDEFAVLIEENHVGTAEARTTGERILQALSIPVDIDGQLVAVSASIGLATADVSGDAATLLRNGDIAMYRAKAAGKARLVEYDEQMGAEAGDAVRVEADLGFALERDELELHYQPVLELATGRLAGFEALVRWRHPELGLLGPDRFIPAGEDTGLIVPIGRWVLDTACAAAVRWRDAGESPPPLTMAVNLSAVQLANDEIVDDVRHALERSGLDPALLVLEITETGLVADPTAAAARLRSLRALGVRLAIDDFGTGYSSLSYLRQFPVDILKIDRSFVDTITDSGGLPPIVRGLLDLARTLDLEIIAEGIENVTQHEGLRHEDCAMGQGFLFSRPLPEHEVEQHLARPRDRSPVPQFP